MAQQGRTQSGGSVPYVSGAIGIASLEDLKAREKAFNLQLVLTLVDDNCVSLFNSVRRPEPSGAQGAALDAMHRRILGAAL